MKDQVKLPVVIVAAVAVVALLVFFGMKAMSAGDLDQGQIKYTPGKPPWEDPLKKPSGEASSQGAAAGSGGMGPPAIGNGTKTGG